MVTFLNSKLAPNQYNGNGQAIDLRLDGTSLDYGDRQAGNTVIYKNANHFITANVETETRNMTATLTAKYRGAGNAYLPPEDLAIHSLDGTSNYPLKMMPSIESISHATGYMNGG